MHNHEKCCEHKNLGYCKVCQVVYCKDCKREWKDIPGYYWTYPVYPTYPTYPTWVGDTVKVSSSSNCQINKHCHD